MRKQYWIGLGAACVIGTAAHFVYDWFPAPLVGLFVPVSESVWEHLKLLYWPVILVALAMSRQRAEKQRFWGAVLTSVLAMPVAMLGIYYTVTAGFGVKSLVFDILLYYATMAAGFALAGRLERSGRAAGWTGVLVMVAGLYGISLIAFTIAAPALPIFMAGHP